MVLGASMPGDPADADRRDRWNERWQRRAYAQSPVVDVLARYAHLLPKHGAALDLACGLGVNALFLAERGLDASAWDYAPVAIERLLDEATRRGLPVAAEVRDVVRSPMAVASFEVIVVARFLERGLCPAIASALRPGGLLFYQSFVRERSSDRGPDDERFRLAPNELLRLFPMLELLAYHDEGAVGDTALGFRDEAMMVARRRQ